MKNLDIRWIRLALVWIVAFVVTLIILSVGRGSNTLTGGVEFSNSFAELLNFTLFSGRTLWTFLSMLSLLMLFFLLDKYGDLSLAGKRPVKLIFMLGAIALGIFAFVAFGKMADAGFSWITVTAFGIPSIVAPLAALRKRAVSTSS